MSKSTLKSILNVTGSQCKDLRTGVICSDVLVLVSILAAAFSVNVRKRVNRFELYLV